MLQHVSVSSSFRCTDLPPLLYLSTCWWAVSDFQFGMLSTDAADAAVSVHGCVFVGIYACHCLLHNTTSEMVNVCLAFQENAKLWYKVTEHFAFSPTV